MTGILLPHAVLRRNGIITPARVLSSDGIITRHERVDPLAQTSFTLRLQTHRGDGLPTGLYKDTACTIPAAQAGDSIAAWRDELSGSGLVALQSVSTKRPTLRFTNGVPWLEFDKVDDVLYVTGSWNAALSISTGVKRTGVTSSWNPVVAAGGLAGASGVPWFLLSPNAPGNTTVSGLVSGTHGGAVGTIRKNGATSPLTASTGEWMAVSSQGMQANVPSGWGLAIGGADTVIPGDNGAPSGIGTTSVLIQPGNVSVTAVDSYLLSLLP